MMGTENRVASADEAKIRQRYRRLWDLVAAATARADSVRFYDNSAVRGPRIVAQLSAGFLVWPTWTPVALTAQWPADTSPG